MSEEEKKELDKKLEELSKEKVPPREPDIMAMCYCPASSRRFGKRKRGGDAWDWDIFDGIEDCKDGESSSTTEEKKSFWKRLFSKGKK